MKQCPLSAKHSAYPQAELKNYWLFQASATKDKLLCLPESYPTYTVDSSNKFLFSYAIVLLVKSLSPLHFEGQFAKVLPYSQTILLCMLKLC